MPLPTLRRGTIFLTALTQYRKPDSPQKALGSPSDHRCPPSPWLSLRPPMPTEPSALPPTTDTHQALGSPSDHRCPPSPWLSLRESWREAPERAHRTNSTHKLPTDPLHRSLIRNCIPPRTVCTSLSPSLREVPLPEGEARAVCELKAFPQTEILRSVHRCPPHPWLSLRESWREAPERAHRTDSIYGLSIEATQRFLS